MNTQELFKEKYLKYKEKYLKLKELGGGAFNNAKAEAMINNIFNKYNKLKDYVYKLKGDLQDVIKKEMIARDAYAADRDDKNTFMLLNNAKNLTNQTKVKLESAERAMNAAGEYYRKTKKKVSEQKLKDAEYKVSVTKNNLYKTKGRLDSFEKNLAATKQKELLIGQKIEETNSLIKRIEGQLSLDEQNLKNVASEQINNLNGDSSPVASPSSNSILQTEESEESE